MSPVSLGSTKYENVVLAHCSSMADSRAEKEGILRKYHILALFYHLMILPIGLCTYFFYCFLIRRITSAAPKTVFLNESNARNPCPAPMTDKPHSVYVMWVAYPTKSFSSSDDFRNISITAMG